MIDLRRTFVEVVRKHFHNYRQQSKRLTYSVDPYMMKDSVVLNKHDELMLELLKVEN